MKRLRVASSERYRSTEFLASEWASSVEDSGSEQVYRFLLPGFPSGPFHDHLGGLSGISFDEQLLSHLVSFLDECRWGVHQAVPQGWLANIAIYFARPIDYLFQYALQCALPRTVRSLERQYRKLL